MEGDTTIDLVLAESIWEIAFSDWLRLKLAQMPGVIETSGFRRETDIKHKEQTEKE